MQKTIQFGKVGVALDAFDSTKDKAKFISLLISGGIRGDFNAKWTEYKVAQKAAGLKPVKASKKK